MKELYKDIKGYENMYQVSNLGNVKSLERTVKGRWGTRKLKERILKVGTDTAGYYYVGLSKDTNVKVINIHKLVAITFLNHKPDGYNIVIDHRDNCQTNNRVDNLQLISHRKNCIKDKRGGTSKYVGVSLNKVTNKYIAQIKNNGKVKGLGHFTNELDAAQAYQTALKQIQNG